MTARYRIRFRQTYPHAPLYMVERVVSIGASTEKEAIQRWRKRPAKQEEVTLEILSIERIPQTSSDPTGQSSSPSPSPSKSTSSSSFTSEI